MKEEHDEAQSEEALRQEETSEAELRWLPLLKKHGA
jgi:hypothetical protein